MTTQERIDALLHYRNVDRMPVVHMGFWPQTLEKWVAEGHLTKEETEGLYDDGDLSAYGKADKAVTKKLGFDGDVNSFVGAQKDAGWYDMPIYPSFGYDVVETYENGSYKMRDPDGVYSLMKDDAQGIPAHLGYSLVDRESWEKEFLPRLQWTDERLNTELLSKLAKENDTREEFLIAYTGSLYGKLRNMWGVEEISCLQFEDPELFEECMEAIANIYYENLKRLLDSGVKFNAGGYWEDICYNKGPLISPAAFDKYTGHNYRKATDLLHSHGIDICLVDCDGKFEALVPTWLDNGVNTMWPMEYGTWEFDFGDLRKKYGKELRGFGNMNKKVFAMDKAAVDKEIERIKRNVDLGGYVPMIDHNIAPDAKWDLVCYYADRMREMKL